MFNAMGAILKHTAICLLSFLVLYLVFSFCLWDFDASQWSLSARFWVVLLWVCITGGGYACYYLAKDL